MNHHLRHVPFVKNIKIRTAIGFILLVLSVALAGIIIGKGRMEYIVFISTCAWIISIFITDKYIHKYPQRYMAYLVASHMKAAIIMAILLWIMGWLIGQKAAPHDVLWPGFILFVLLDALASVPCQSVITDNQCKENDPVTEANDPPEDRSIDADYLKSAVSIDKQTLLNKITSELDKPFLDFIENNLSDIHGVTGDISVLDDIPMKDHQPAHDAVSLLIGRARINDVLRLNHFMQYCTERIRMGGYFVIRYLEYENIKKKLKDRYRGPFYWAAFIFHFLWYRAIPKIPWLEKLYFTSPLSWLDTIHLSFVKKRNRALSKAEVWGRLSFYGMNVLVESEGGNDRFIIAQRVALPVQNKIPSFYFIASLEKVGLDGKSIHTHKIRTMYPFSEFIQKRIFDDHGLATTGKFANDFRLTDYGRIMRKYWLDELPQVFDWLRGDIKLVGMRATSRHFLSLYPQELYDLYIQIKPGLIPPIFDENTSGFDQIVQIELTYLKSYWEQPFWTDVRYFMKTFMDIVFRGVRSK